MPELPEVETIVRHLAPLVSDQTIKSFEAFWPRQVNPSIAHVRRAVTGRKITRLGRRGKYLAFFLDDQTILSIHLGMSGNLIWEDGATKPVTHNHLRALLRMSGGGRLLFIDARKFGRIQHARDKALAFGHLGIEPLEPVFTPQELRKRLRSFRRQLKPLLLDQTLVAGLGNIYVDEALFRARLHPRVCSNNLTNPQINRLHRSVKHVLKQAIEQSGTSFDWAYPGGNMQHHLRVYGRSGKRCYRCNSSIQRILVAQRGTHYCPVCQPDPDSSQ